jgi:OMF family outer membrane factor
MRILLAAIVSLVVLAPAAHADQHLTFAGAIALALGENPDVAGAREAVAGADAHTEGIKARRLPSLHVDLDGNLYANPYILDFFGQKFRLYKADTSVTSVTIAQPLTGLGYLSDLIGAAKHDANATHDEYDRVRLETAYHTAEAYIRVLEARATADVAHRSVADIQSELDRAVQLRQADTYTDIDVLRFRSAKAAADRDALRADTTRDEALATLVVQLGLPDGAQVGLDDDLPPAPPPLAMSLDQALSRALTARPELHAAREHVAAADRRRRSAYDEYFPEINAIANWTHLSGVQPFQPEDAEFVALRLSWNVWDWGATHQGVLEAERTEARATIAERGLIDQVRLDVRKKWLDAKTAFDSLAVAETQQQTADEALRLQKVRFDAAAATTTDVLDAETDAARARLARAVARYDYYLAMVGLARAVGDMPAT